MCVAAKGVLTKVEPGEAEAISVTIKRAGSTAVDVQRRV